MMRIYRILIPSLIIILLLIPIVGQQVVQAAQEQEVHGPSLANQSLLLQTAAPGPAETPISGITPSAPGEDGSIVHVVEYGQSLYAIAEAYGVGLAELQSLNGLIGSEIYVGDTLIIRLPFTVTPTVHTTPTLKPTYTPRPTRTPAPTRPSPTPTREPAATATPDPELAEESDNAENKGIFSDPLLIGISVLAGVGILMMGAGSMLKRISK